MDVARVKKWNDLKDRKSALEDELDGVKSELAQLDEEIQEDFVSDGIQNVSVDGHTVYLHGQVWARKVDVSVTTEDLCAALNTAGAGDLVKENVNSQTLSSWVREFEDEAGHIELPPEMEGIIEPVKVFSIRRRKS